MDLYFILNFKVKCKPKKYEKYEMILPFSQKRSHLSFYVFSNISLPQILQLEHGSNKKGWYSNATYQHSLANCLQPTSLLHRLATINGQCLFHFHYYVPWILSQQLQYLPYRTVLRIGGVNIYEALGNRSGTHKCSITVSYYCWSQLNTHDI